MKKIVCAPAHLIPKVLNNDTIYVIWNLSFELLYAITAIIIIIHMLKNKAKNYEIDI